MSLRRNVYGINATGLMLPYKCKFCNGFHFGHAPAKVTKSYYAKRG